MNDHIAKLIEHRDSYQANVDILNKAIEEEQAKVATKPDLNKYVGRYFMSGKSVCKVIGIYDDKRVRIASHECMPEANIMKSEWNVCPSSLDDNRTELTEKQYGFIKRKLLKIGKDCADALSNTQIKHYELMLKVIDSNKREIEKAK